MIMNVNKLTVAAFLATASILGTFTTAATPRRRGLKQGKASKNAAKMLGVQNGVDCSIEEVKDTGKSGVYYLIISKMNQDTIQFEERPGRAASIIPTANFTNAFSATFLSSEPNTAITIHQKNSGGPASAADGQQEATIIVQLSNPIAINNGKGLQYTFEQSESQAGVGSLEAFVKVAGDGTNNGCSLFIDGWLFDPIEALVELVGHVEAHAGGDVEGSYNSTTNFCYLGGGAVGPHTNGGEYCWYPTSIIYELCLCGSWTEVHTQGNDNCGPACAYKTGGDCCNKYVYYYDIRVFVFFPHFSSFIHSIVFCTTGFLL